MTSLVISETLPGELWEPIRGTSATYWISNQGRVCSLKNQRQTILRNKLTSQGYIVTHFLVEGNNKNYLVHRLVAIYFIKNLNNLPIVNHIDGNKRNNHMSNLEWATALDNMRHAYRIGLHSKKVIKSPVIPRDRYFSKRQIRRKVVELSIENERWKPIPGYDEQYWVSDKGGCISFKHGNFRLLKNIPNRLGYQLVALCTNNKRKFMLVHRLVALAFIPNVRNCPDIHHKDGDPKNNDVNNLQWVTESENTTYAHAMGAFAHVRLRPFTKEDREKNIALRIRKIYQWSLAGDFIKEYPSITAANLAMGLSRKDGSLSACAGGHRQTCAGFQWSYHNNPETINKNVVMDKAKKRQDLSWSKIGLEQIKDGVVIKKWPSIKSAALTLKLTRSTLRTYVNTERVWQGFVWRLAA